MINEFSLIALLMTIVLSNKEILVEEFNALTFDSNDWSCLNQGQSAPIYHCPFGMDLVQLSFECNKINKIYTNIPPHYSIQVYIDFFPMRNLENYEYASLLLDNVQIVTQYRESVQYYNQCSSQSTYFAEVTQIYSQPHKNNQLNIIFETNQDEFFSDEGFPFRNLQVFYNRCYKTCKTCQDDSQNGCLSCFTQNQPINFECDTCQKQTNKQFLLSPNGCIQECPTGYTFQNDYICEKSELLNFFTQLNTIQPQISQDLSLNPSSTTLRSPKVCSTKSYLVYYQQEQLYYNIILPPSSVALRMRVTFSFFGSWNSNQQLQVLFDDQIISSISLNRLIVNINNGIILNADQNYQNCQRQKLFETRIEINQIVSNTNFNLKFQASQVFDNQLQWAVTNITLESIKCSLNCLNCFNQRECNQCDASYFIYKGQCVSVCPEFTEKNYNNCIDLDEEIVIPNNSKSRYLIKEFYDLSTTQERIGQLFALLYYSTYNFAKGPGIYFSYLPNKRVFGGSLVWVDARFQFSLSLPNYFYKIRIKFQVVLGDNFDPGYFSYQLNTNTAKTISKATPNPILIQQLWGDNYNEYIYQVDEYMNRDFFDNLALNIIFNCNNPTKYVNQAFCAIQNFFITAIYNCPIEYRFDLFQYYENQFPCISICGDGRVVDKEECDDGNNLPYDGCYNCKFECNITCIFCVYGECLLDEEGEGDVQIFHSLNKTQNSYQFEQNDLVYKNDCQFECIDCFQSYCYKCKDGYYLNYDQVCQSICGDTKITGLEECDDGNDDIYDGCANCQLVNYQKCHLNCAVCYLGECFKCKFGYSQSNDECIQICGDNFVNYDKVNGELSEQCDNPENEGCIDCIVQPGYLCVKYDQSICWTCDEKCVSCIAFQDSYILECKQCVDGYYPIGQYCYLCDDNCVTCKDERDLCTSCYREDCQKCEDIPGLYTNLDLRKCEPLCGDGIKIEFYEQCDDGNIDEGDGCDAYCNLELAKETSQLQIIRQNGEQSNDINIGGSKNINIACSELSVTIEGFLPEEFSYNTTMTEIGCQIKFQFLKSITQANKIHVTVNYSENYSRILSEILSKEFIITPVNQVILDNSQQGQADVISNAQSSLSIIIWILAPLSILLGLFDYFWAILDILSWINNFYFLNVKYPFNVQILFLNSDWSSIINFPTYNGFNQPGCEYYVQSPQRFQEKGVDPLFINNAQVPFYFIMVSVFLYFLTFFLQQIFQFINQNCIREKAEQVNQISIFCIQQQKEQEQQKKKQITVTISYNKYIQMILAKLKEMSQEFRGKIKQTITLCSLDITMAITLQLVFANQFQHPILIINSILALIFSTVLIYQLYQTFFVISIHKDLAEFPQFKLQYGCFYENINVENSYGFQFNFVCLIRKISYIFCTVYFYDSPTLQTGLCFLSCVSGVFLLIYSNPFETKQQFVKQIISEAGLSIIVLITIIFSIDDQINKMSDEFKIILGWIIIAIVGISVLNEILTLFYEILKYIYLKLKFVIGQKQKQKVEIQKSHSTKIDGKTQFETQDIRNKCNISTTQQIDLQNIDNLERQQSNIAWLNSQQ